jgi:hypothetical protein
MWRSIVVLAALVGAIGLATLGPVGAAELGARTHVVHPDVRTVYCGPCGCLGAKYVYHRELRSTYGLNFDPRNYDTTQPHYYFGPMRAWPRYFVEGWPGPGALPGLIEVAGSPLARRPKRNISSRRLRGLRQGAAYFSNRDCGVLAHPRVQGLLRPVRAYAWFLSNTALRNRPVHAFYCALAEPLYHLRDYSNSSGSRVGWGLGTGLGRVRPWPGHC